MEKDLISLIEEFLLEQPTDINNNIFYQEDVGGVKYEFVLELPDDIPTKTGISGNEIIDVKKLSDNTLVNVQRVFPDGETVVDYSFNARGKGGDVEAYKNFNKILKEGEGMKGVLLNYYDTFPVETTLPTTNNRNNRQDIAKELSRHLDNIDKKELVANETIFYHGSDSPNMRMIGRDEISKDAGKYLHTGTYRAAVDRMSGAFADQSIWNLGNSLDSHFEEVIGYNGELKEHFDDLISQKVEPSDMPAFEHTVEYSITTDKVYVSQAHLVAEIDQDYIINVRLDWTQNVNNPVRQTVDPSFAEVLYDDVTKEYDNYSSRSMNWSGKIGQNVPDPFSTSFGYEIKPKPNSSIEVLDQAYIFLNTQDKKSTPFVTTGDSVLNDFEFLDRGMPDVRIDWYNFDVVLSGDLNSTIRFFDDPNDLDAFNKLKQTTRPDFLNMLNQADILGYINDVEDPGSISYAVKNKDAVDITRMNEQSTAQFQIDIDNRSMEMNTVPYDLFDETGEIIEYSEDAMRSYRNGITARYNSQSIKTPKQITDQRNANYYNNLIQKLPDTKGPGTGMGPGAALANNTSEFINQLPIEQSIKDKTIERITKHTAGLAAKTATPDPMQALDIYEDFVMLAGLAYAFAPDVGTFVKNQANNMLETMANAAGYNVKLQDFEYDWERVSDTMDWVESVSPTDIVINKVGDLAKGAAETGMVTGFGYVPKNLNSTLGNTLTSATTTKEKERDPMYDRISRTFSGKY